MKTENVLVNHCFLVSIKQYKGGQQPVLFFKQNCKLRFRNLSIQYYLPRELHQFGQVSKGPLCFTYQHKIIFRISIACSSSFLMILFLMYYMFNKKYSFAFLFYFSF